MEIIGTTRIKDGIECDEMVVKCSEHEFYYKGRPPLTHGCADCWLVYFFGQIAQSSQDAKLNVDQLEAAIKHAAELVEQGKWDFKPSYEVEFGTEN